MNDSALIDQPYIIIAIKTEHILGNKTMMHATDLRKDIPIVLINISNEEVIGRISIPSQFLNDQFKAKHLVDTFNDRFDGKCIHDGTRYETSVCDFRLNKQLVNDTDLNSIFKKIENVFKQILGK